jgi:hypothetical protein
MTHITPKKERLLDPCGSGADLRGSGAFSRKPVRWLGAGRQLLCAIQLDIITYWRV